MRVLVTGAAGFVGRHVVAHLGRDHEVVAAYRHEAQLSTPGVRAVAMDLETVTTPSLRAAVGGGIDVVVHLAARLDNPFGVDYTLAELVPPNVVGTVRVLEAAADLGVRRFVYGSTGGVGTNPPLGERMHEDDAPGPINPYGLTKHLAEQAILAYEWPFERVSLRYFAPYARDGSNPMFLHHLAAIQQGEPIGVGRDGGGELNPVHIDDAVAATVAAVDAPDLPTVINIAGPEVVTMTRLLQLLGQAIGREPVIEEHDGPGLSWAADIGRMTKFLRAPRISVVEGIAREWGGAAVSPP